MVQMSVLVTLDDELINFQLFNFSIFFLFNFTLRVYLLEVLALWGKCISSLLTLAASCAVNSFLMPCGTQVSPVNLRRSRRI